jgi:hypothetical protein
MEVRLEIESADERPHPESHPHHYGHEHLAHPSVLRFRELHSDGQHVG